MKFTIECEMKDRWVSPFLSMLKNIEHNGEIGHSEFVGIYSDGDGDFRPKFNTDISFAVFHPYPDNEYQMNNIKFYDADYNVSEEQYEKHLEEERLDRYNLKLERNKKLNKHKN